jgi:hypothetical protein
MRDLLHMTAIPIEEAVVKQINAKPTRELPRTCISWVGIFYEPPRAA